ncbi:replication initiator protein [Klebsiella quasipneumoniae subsp. similipneumoniae]|nr:replication initiator protein [Klebsiella quasipneumoniae]AZJ30977.1 replication initiator protein [Klebsiella quasipneumoniae subsp. similipneumoniae]OVV99056.1 replication initiator protein [Klebsiella quasipneumoniae subsp. similipneumoniae]OVW13846.1 replication initiator protein [Klebsiella quasipneumoniae subsp. similipneumoniae]OVW21743.1 replication initiator protein [Klebsiella quasipneumoniae subsp. similipneumoniae]
MGSCAAPSAKGDDKFITTDYLQQCQISRQLDFIWLGGITSIILNLAVGEKISAHRYIPSRFIVP